jgi:hypothetical protein
VVARGLHASPLVDSHLPPSDAILLFCFVAGILVFILRKLLSLHLVWILS